MKKGLRASTVAKSNQSKEALRKRVSEANRKKSLKLLRLAEKEAASINEALELSVLVESDNNTGSDLDEKTDTSAKDTNTNTEEEISDLSQSQEEYWYDSSHNELTGPLESPVTPLSDLDQDPDTWSSINQFFPHGCLRSPPFVPEVQRAASLPVLALTPSLHSLSVTLTDGEFNQPGSSRESSGSPPSPALTLIMSLDNINAKVKEYKKLRAALLLMIDCYNKDTVTILDRDDYKDELKNIQESLTKLQGKLVDIQDLLDKDDDEQKSIYNEVTTMFDEAKQKVITNATSVKRQIVKLISDAESSSVSSSSEADRKKLVLKVTNATARFKSLKDELENLDEVSAMSDNQIRESLLASKEWKKDLKTFESLKETLDVDMITITIEEDLKNNFQKEYKEVVELVKNKMSELVIADKDLGLYSLAETKNKTMVQYPDPFSGTLGENVFRFIKDFKQAIADDQVRKADEVKTLMKHLKGDAKHTIGEHHISLKSALKQLEDNYGCPRLIVEKYTRDYDKALGSIRSWGKHGTKESVDAINRTVDFIRNLENLATDHPGHLKS